MAKKETLSPTAPMLPMLKTVEQMSKVSGIGENKLRELMDSGELASLFFLILDHAIHNPDTVLFSPISRP